MIVEPASIHSRSPLRRLLRAVGLVAPVALFVTLVAAGLLGPKPAQDTGVDASASALAVVSPSAAPASSPSAETTTPATIPPLAGFPASYRSLPAESPSAVLAARASSGGPPAVVIVAGYLEVSGAPSHCGSPMITFGAWCERLGTLFETPPASGASAALGARPPHLHVTIPAGVVLPSAVTGGSADAGSVPVVAVGRFASAGSCGGDPRSCDQGFVVERVVWAGGASAPLQPLLEPNQGAGLSTKPPITMNPDVVTLLAVLARPATVARLDPAAGAAAARIESTTRLLWYIRDVIVAQDGSLLPRWLLLDPYTGSLIATAPSEAPPVSAAAPGSPAPQG